MAEYIEKEFCRENFANAVRVILRDDRTNERAEEILDAFDSLPAADVRENVQGEWIEDGCITKCGICGEEKRFPHWIACPACGADMRTKEDNEMPGGTCGLYPSLEEHRKNNPSTKADRIRAMSDEEIAEMLEELLVCGDECPVVADCHGRTPLCKQMLLDWLKSPAEG